MRLTVIGCSGSYPGPDAAASCYLLEADQAGRTWRILLDLGSGALGALHRYVDPLNIDAVIISHLHADHFFDISGLYVLRKYHPSGAQPRIPVWGPKGTGKRCAGAYGLDPVVGMNEEFDFRSLAGGPFTVGPFEVTPALVCHPIEAYGLRVEVSGRSIVYSGDTGPCPALDVLAQGADVLLAEAAFRDGCDNPADLHLTGSEAARAAREAGVGRLVLTHIPPWHKAEDALLEAEPVFDGPIDLAAEGLTFEV
jgi:ribonuclease BN (tRNA processing enzyme)